MLGDRGALVRGAGGQGGPGRNVDEHEVYRVSVKRYRSAGLLLGFLVVDRVVERSFWGMHSIVDTRSVRLSEDNRVSAITVREALQQFICRLSTRLTLSSEASESSDL